MHGRPRFSLFGDAFVRNPEEGGRASGDRAVIHQSKVWWFDPQQLHDLKNLSEPVTFHLKLNVLRGLRAKTHKQLRANLILWILRLGNQFNCFFHSGSKKV